MRRYVAAVARCPSLALFLVAALVAGASVHALWAATPQTAVGTKAMRIADASVAETMYAYESATLRAQQHAPTVRQNLHSSSQALALANQSSPASSSPSPPRDRGRTNASISAGASDDDGSGSSAEARSQRVKHALAIIFVPREHVSLESPEALREIAQVELALQSSHGYEEHALESARRSIIDSLFEGADRQSIVEQQLQPSKSLKQAYMDLSDARSFIFPLSYDPIDNQDDAPPKSLRSGFPYHPSKAAKSSLQRDVPRALDDVHTDFIDFYYGGSSLTQYLLRQIVRNDSTQALIGLAFVAALMAAAFCSVWLPIAGSLLILSSVSLTYWVLVIVVRLDELPVVLTISLYVAVAIGVDDLFALTVETLQRRATHGPLHSLQQIVDLYARSLSHAGMAIFATSLTTAVAFLSNLVSPLPAIRLYGIASASVVLLNLALTFTWYIAALLFWERNLAHLCSGISCNSLTDGAGPVVAAAKRAGYVVANFVVRRASVVLGISSAAAACGIIVFMMRATLDKSTPQLFNDNVNAQAFITLSREHYGADGLSSSGLQNGAPNDSPKHRNDKNMSPSPAPPKDCDVTLPEGCNQLPPPPNDESPPPFPPSPSPPPASPPSSPQGIPPEVPPQQSQPEDDRKGRHPPSPPTNFPPPTSPPQPSEDDDQSPPPQLPPMSPPPIDNSSSKEQPPSDSGLSPPADDGDNERRGQLMKVTLTVGILGLKSSELALKPSELVSPEAARLQPLNMSDPEAQQYLLELCDTVAETYDLKSCVWRDIVAYAKQRLNVSMPLSEGNLSSAVGTYLDSMAMQPLVCGDMDVDDNFWPLWMRIKAESNTSVASSFERTQKTLRDWRNFVENATPRRRPQSVSKPKLTSDGWMLMTTKNELVSGATHSILIASGCALGSAFVMTGSLAIISLLLFTLVVILAGVLGILTLLGYDIGVIEGLALTALIGLSFDHVLHLVEGFLLSEAESLPMKAKEALYHKFVPVLGAACTTVLACVPAFFTRIKLLRIFAQVISISMMSGAFFSFAFFIPLCSLVGPRADSCEGYKKRLKTSLVGRRQCTSSHVMRWALTAAHVVTFCSFLLLTASTLTPPLSSALFEQHLPAAVSLLAYVAIAPLVLYALEAALEEQSGQKESGVSGSMV